MSPPAPPAGRRPLDGIRVLELGQLMAGPLAGTLLGWFGAEVIKVEDPRGGDPVRRWRVLDEGTSLWWRHLARNKRLVAIDLRRRRGRSLVRRLALTSDVLLENFRPGTLEAFGLAPDDLRAENPGLVVARVSGFGQTGPYRDRRGFASVCEAMGGLRYVTGHPGEPPVRANLSLGDTLAAFHAAIGILLSLLHRERGGAGRGQDVDVAITEAVFACLEAAVSEYDRAGVVRGPSGTTITGVVPTDAYPTRDGHRVVIGGNGDAIFRRLMEAAGRADLAADCGLGTNEGRVARREEIDRAIAAWTEGLDRDELLSRLEQAGVPAGPVQSVADLVRDPQVLARDLLETHVVGGRPLRLPAIPPRLGATPGRTAWVGGTLGADTDAVLETCLGLDGAERVRLRRDGVIA